MGRICGPAWPWLGFLVCVLVGIRHENNTSIARPGAGRQGLHDTSTFKAKRVSCPLSVLPDIPLGMDFRSVGMPGVCSAQQPLRGSWSLLDFHPLTQPQNLHFMLKVFPNEGPRLTAGKFA